MPQMKTYIVITRIPDLKIGPDPKGAAALYIAKCATEDEALEAVRQTIPADREIDCVAGVAKRELEKLYKMEPGMVRLLGSKP